MFQFLDTELSLCHLTQKFVNFYIQQLHDCRTEVSTPFYNIEIPGWHLELPLLCPLVAICAFPSTLPQVLDLNLPVRSRLLPLSALTCRAHWVLLAPVVSFPGFEETIYNPSLGSLGSCSVSIRVWHNCHSSLELSVGFLYIICYPRGFHSHMVMLKLWESVSREKLVVFIATAQGTCVSDTKLHLSFLINANMKPSLSSRRHWPWIFSLITFLSRVLPLPFASWESC